MGDRAQFYILGLTLEFSRNFGFDLGVGGLTLMIVNNI